MLDQSLELPIVSQVLADDIHLGEVLFFPEFSRIGATHEKMAEYLSSDVTKWLDDLESSHRLELHRRLLRADFGLIECRFDIHPPPQLVGWTEPVEVRFHGVQWMERDRTVAAFFPTLGVEVLADSFDELPQQCELETLGALRRMKITQSLEKLVMAQRTESLAIHIEPLQTAWSGLKQTVRREESGDEQEKTVLEEVATKIADNDLKRIYERDTLVARLRDELFSQRASSILLVGPSGVGKTAVVEELVRQQPAAEREKRPFWSTDGAKLISGMMGFGMWQERCEQLWQECVRQHAILHVGSLIELMEVGKSEGQSQGIASFLRPYIARGDMLVIAECTPEQIAMLERNAPQLLAAFQRVEVPEPNVEQELSILSQVLAESSGAGRPSIMTDSALSKLASLHRRYATYSASPGRPLRFLNNLISDHTSTDPALAEPDVTEAFSKETGLPLPMLEESAPLSYGETLDWFSQRVIGQTAAVKTVVDLLLTMKANLNRENRPLASLLFVGPTGVGKTELAKTLARFLFGSAQRLLRLDMSEYADGLAVQRLIGGLFEKEGVLTSRVREQPFSVVLLDEFEKAHPLFFDLLLQVLGEGRLTDGSGRLADFRNCVVIMTSNLGTEDFGQQKVGFESTQSVETTEDHFRRAVEQFVRPELYNRIDRVISFHPLSEATARKIIDREVDLIQERDGLKFRPVQFSMDDEVADYLLREGFEPKYGARSLKRVMEREILISLANGLNRFGVEAPLRASATLENGNVRVKVESQAHDSAEVQRRSDYRLLENAQDLRRFWQRLSRCSAVQELRDRLFRLEKSERRLLKRKKLNEEDLRKLEQRRLVAERLRQVDTAGEGLVNYEDQALLQLCMGDTANGDSRDPSGLEPSGLDRSGDGLPEERFAPSGLSREELAARHREDVASWERQIDDVTMLVHSDTFDEPEKIQMFIYGGTREALGQMCRLYVDVAKQLQGRAVLWQFRLGNSQHDLPEQQWNLEEMKWHADVVPREHKAMYDQAFWVGIKPAPPQPVQKQLRRWRVRGADEFLEDGVPRGTLGVFLEVSGPMVYPRFMSESGLHEFVEKQGKTHCRVIAELPKVGRFLPQFRFHREPMGTKFVRRRYRPGSLEDFALKRDFAFGRTGLFETFSQLMMLNHRALAKEIAEQ